MVKIVYVPVDERPCNYDFPQEIFKDSDIEVVVPSKKIMSHKKDPADTAGLQTFLKEETKAAYGLVIALDTLLYGGLVPSRIHYLPEDTLLTRLATLKTLKQANKDLKIFAFQIIMRCPQHNSADEEPPYYKTCGRQIYLNGYFEHRQKLSLISETELQQFSELKLEKNHLNDFVSRRNLNLQFDLKSLELVSDNLIDFMIFCQDDASEFGYPAMDQEKIQQEIKNRQLMMKAYTYCGADELGCTLVARMLNDFLGKKPAFYIKYPSPTSPTVIPCLEDRYLDNTIRFQIIGAGGIVVPSIQDADIVLLALMGATQMLQEPNYSNVKDIDVLCNLVETFEFAKWASRKGYPIVVADLFFLNAGSVAVLDYIKQSGLLLSLASYSGWNTSSNALGTAISQGICHLYYGSTKAHLEFLIKRYVEDIGYCGIVRGAVAEKIKTYSMNYFNTFDQFGIASGLVENGLREFIQSHLSEIKDIFELSNVNLPWRRMFEVGFTISLKDLSEG